MAQWKRVWLITRRTVDRNHQTRFFSSLAQWGAPVHRTGGHRFNPCSCLGQPVIAQLVERLTVDQLVTCSTQVDGNRSQRVRKNSLPLCFGLSSWQSERLQFVWSGVRLTGSFGETLWIMRGQSSILLLAAPISTVEAALNPLAMVSFRQLSCSETSLNYATLPELV